MDRRSFEKAKRSASRWRNKLESTCATAAEMWAASFRRAVSSEHTYRLTPWIKESAGNRNIWDGLNLFAQETLRSRKPLPDELALWAADVLADALAGKRLQPMRSGSRHVLRNLLIVTAIGQLATNGYHPIGRTYGTRGPWCCPEGRSVCDAVGMAFEDLDPKLKYRSIEALWTAHRKREPLAGRPRPKRRVPRRHRRVRAAIETLLKEPPADPKEQRRALAVLKNPRRV